MKIIDKIKHYTASEISELLGVNQRSLYYLISKREEWDQDCEIEIIPEGKAIGRRIYYTKEDIEKFQNILKFLKNNNFKKAYRKAREEAIKDAAILDFQNKGDFGGDEIGY